MQITSKFTFVLQVQDIEFAQIEMKVIEGLKVGNDCLKKMHEVTIRRKTLLVANTSKHCLCMYACMNVFLDNVTC